MDDAGLTATTGSEGTSSVDQKLGGGLKHGPVNVSVGQTKTHTEKQTSEMVEQFRRSKVEFLRRHVLDYQQLVEDMSDLSNGDAFLILDDLYHIRRADQASVVDYLHSIAKGHRVWLKVGTIRHRSTWFVPGDPPRGMATSEDADEVNLDLTLEKYALAKRFLLEVLENLAKTHSLTTNDFLTDGAIDRLVLASAGVARDFLAIVRKAVDTAREKGHEKITAEDVNAAAGEHDTAKQEELQRDTYKEETQSLNTIFESIKTFCIESTKCNCFLLDKGAKGTTVDAIRQLVDLKLLHLIRSRVTVSKRQGLIFEAYMLDVSQYAGARARRGFEIIEFWKQSSDDKLRKVSLIFNAV
jgi:hypothetical protein